MHQENTNGCCLTTRGLHEYCEYKLPVEKCKSFCDQDPHCKGYDDKGYKHPWNGNEYCYTATISHCGRRGQKHNSGKTGNLDGTCVVGYLGNGCYVKRMENNLSCRTFHIITNLICRKASFLFN